jgi:putative oxygen-independent coproporphyrinogen III oxidase
VTPEAADATADATAAYVHIPFCARVCPYCDFAVVAGRDDLAERYTRAVISEIEMTAIWRPLDSVYVGGGTPSHLDPGLLGQVLEAIGHRHGIGGGAEITLEANPEDFDTDRARILAGVGFNRVSFGAQSLDPVVLAALGRRHLPDDIARSVEAARHAGFDNVSVDLIFGTPGETEASWAASVSRVGALGVDHVSCYSLTVEPGTPLAREVRAGAPGPDPDVQADRYQHADETLGGFGLARYEVSNWSRPDRECRYNMTVWAQGEYLAHGNGAHGFLGGRRYRNLRRLDSYLEAVEAGRAPRAGAEVIAGWDAELDRLFVGLRRVVGVSHGPGTRALLSDPDGRRLVDAGVVEDTGQRLVVRRPLLTDMVHRTVLGLSPPAGWEEGRRADIVVSEANA